MVEKDVYLRHIETIPIDLNKFSKSSQQKKEF